VSISGLGALAIWGFTPEDLAHTVDAASGKTFSVQNPATGEVIAQAAEGDKKDSASSPPSQPPLELLFSGTSRAGEHRI
jgi:hypothetical protein